MRACVFVQCLALLFPTHKNIVLYAIVGIVLESSVYSSVEAWAQVSDESVESRGGMLGLHSQTLCVVPMNNDETGLAIV